MLSLLLSHPDSWTEVCERVGSSVYMQRCVVAHMRKAVEGYLCFLIFFIVFDVLSWSSRSRSWIISQMDTSDLLKICPITAYSTSEEKPVIVLALFSQLCNVIHTKRKKKAVVEILDLIQISFHHISKQTRRLHWPWWLMLIKTHCVGMSYQTDI